MASVISPNQVFAGGDSDRDGWLVTWTGMKLGDIGGPPSHLIGFADHTVQVEGNFGVGGKCDILGSNDGANYRILHDPWGNPLNVSAAAINQVAEACVDLIPQVSGGDNSTQLTVTALFRRTKP